MPFSNAGELKEAIQSWMDRTDIEGNSSDFLTLAEAGLNRELEALEVDTDLTGVTDSLYIDISGLGIDTPLDLFLNDYGREWPLLKMSDGDFPTIEISGKPSVWAYNDGRIMFDRPLSAAYTFRLHHTAKFDLEEDTDTNWLLINHPDVYLAACIVWGAQFVADDDTRARYSGPLAQFIASVNQHERKRNKGQLTSDAALTSIGRRRYWWWGQFPGGNW